MHDVAVRWAEADAPAAAERLLTDVERGRLRTLRRRADRARLRSAHVLVRLLVAELAGVTPDRVVLTQECHRCGGPHGRPWVSIAGRPGPHVSMTHAGGLVAAAAADRAVGIDVEPLGRAMTGIDQTALSLREQRLLGALAPARRDDALIRWWVRKEAVLKATGHGVEVDPRHVEVSPPDAVAGLVGWSAPVRRPHLQLVDVAIHPEHAATLAVLGRRAVRPIVERVQLSALPW